MGWRPSAVDNFRVNARRPRRVVDVAATLEAISTLAEILTQHGPLHKDEIAQDCRDRGMDDPDSAIQKCHLGHEQLALASPPMRAPQDA
jgi:hypothetical protein